MRHSATTTSTSTTAAAVLTAALAFASTSCATTLPPARLVRSDQLGTVGPLRPGEALIVEFQPGDTIPLTVTLDGPFVKTPEHAEPIPLRVVRHFYLRIDEHGMKASPDGKTFDWPKKEPGSFRAGIGVSAHGVQATIAIHTPVPSSPPLAPAPAPSR